MMKARSYSTTRDHSECVKRNAGLTLVCYDDQPPPLDDSSDSDDEPPALVDSSDGDDRPPPLVDSSDSDD
jgi:hypothetical protein